MDYTPTLSIPMVLSFHIRGGKHFIYSKYDFLRPDGVLVWCHNRACKEPLTRRAHSKHVYKCGECHSTCTTLLVKMDQTTLLGHITVVKTPYPQPQYPVEWSWPELVKAAWEKKPIMAAMNPPAPSDLMQPDGMTCLISLPAGYSIPII